MEESLNPSGYETPPMIPGSRSYDDEDAELQAALRASLESHTPSGSAPAPPAPAPAPVRAMPSVPPSAKPAEDDDEEDEEEEEQAPAASSPPIEAKAEVADPDEVRRRRLARFGA